MWNDGYVAEVDYIPGYFGEMSIDRIRLALLSRGIAHAIGPRPTYLELGFGQGLTLAINAAVSSGNFYGTDFNPAQVANARELADASGRVVAIFEDSFEELATRDGLPQFDVIALHGIWSWISDAGRAAIVEIARRRLNPGGVLYVSYNVMAGWASSMPLRQLLREYSRRTAKGEILTRVDQSIDFARRMAAAGAGYFAQNPAATERLETIARQNRTYVSHEYFNQNWSPSAFTDVCDALDVAKLRFAASATLLDNVDAISIAESALPLLAEIGDVSLREMVRDYFVGQQFRRDLFVKGVRQMTPAQLRAQRAAQAFILLGDPAAPPRTIRGGAGEAALRPDIYDPIVAAIAAAPDTPVSVASLAPVLAGEGLNEVQLWEALLVLAGANYLAPASQSATPEADLAAAARFNTAVCERACWSSDLQYLAAPRIGGGVSVSKIEQLLMLAGRAQADDPVDYVLAALAAQGESLLVEGRAVTDPAEARAQLVAIAADFAATRRPLLDRLGCVLADG